MNLTTLIILGIATFYLEKACRQPASAWETTLRSVARRPAPAALPPAPEKPVRARRARAKAAA